MEAGVVCRQQDAVIEPIENCAGRPATLKRKGMITRFKLWDGRKVTVEQTMTGYTAQTEGENEKRRITSTDYMRLVLNAQIC